MSKLTVRPDQNKSYQSAITALEDNGFAYEGDFYGERNPVSRKVKKYKIFSKESTLYYFVSMDHFNTTIYKVVLKVLPKPLGHYSPN